MTELRRRPPGSVADLDQPPVLSRRQRVGQWAPFVALAAIVLAALFGAALGGDGPSPAERVVAGPREAPSTPVSVLGNAVEAPATTAAAAPATTVRRGPTTTGAVLRQVATPVVTTVRPSTATTLPVATTAAPVATTAGSTPVSTAAPTTSTTVSGCRNSTNPACGPFRFDPQPGPDSPMTVQVAMDPATPTPGDEVAFRLTLTDPDGVSYNGTTFGFGDGGLNGASFPPCEKFGAWDPPAPDPATATEVLVVRHTYLNAGTYRVSFAFDAGPFACVDSVTGRGDRPYASSATGTATVVVG